MSTSETPASDEHAHDTGDKLVYMANQISKFFITQDSATAPDKIAEHIKKFWDPRMRSTIVAHLDAGGAGLTPPVRAAVEKLRPTAS